MEHLGEVGRVLLIWFVQWVISHLLNHKQNLLQERTNELTVETNRLLTEIIRKIDPKG